MNATLLGVSTSRDSSNSATRAMAQFLLVSDGCGGGGAREPLDARAADTHRADSALYTLPTGQSRKFSGTPPL